MYLTGNQAWRNERQMLIVPTWRDHLSCTEGSVNPRILGPLSILMKLKIRNSKLLTKPCYTIDREPLFFFSLQNLEGAKTLYFLYQQPRMTSEKSIPNYIQSQASYLTVQRKTTLQENTTIVKGVAELPSFYDKLNSLIVSFILLCQLIFFHVEEGHTRFYTDGNTRFGEKRPGISFSFFYLLHVAPRKLNKLSENPFVFPTYGLLAMKSK